MAGYGEEPNLKREQSADDNDVMPMPRSLFRNNRSKSMFGIQPSSQFGRRGVISKSKECKITIYDPRSQRLTWDKKPSNVLVIRKIHDDGVTAPFLELLRFLAEVKSMNIYVEEKSYDEAVQATSEHYKSFGSKVHTFKDGRDNLSDKIDLIITLGGDGTLLYASSLFPASVPPLMSFHLGSLGFLSPFNFSEYKSKIEKVLEGEVPLCLRTRFKCFICPQSKPPSTADLPLGSRGFSVQWAMNDVVVDRGPSAYLCYLDLYIDDRYITSVQGDGLIIATPTGSTAYAAAAGASMVHPNVPAIIIVPICPHSLSFRPIIVPSGVEVRINLNDDTRGTAMMSFDGRNRTELKPGDILRISASAYPIPSISAHNPTQDWFESLSTCLHWNVRKPQKSLSTSQYEENGTEAPPDER